GDPQEAWGLAGAWRVRAALRAALGDADAAAESLTQARALAEQLRRNAADGETGARFLTHTLLEQADHALRSSDIERAREAADRARMLAEMYARKPEASPIWLADAANCWDRLGETARAVDDSAKTLDAFARAVELRRRALRAAGDDLRYKRGLAASLLKFGEAALDAGVGDTARGAFQESASLRSRLLE